MAAIIPTIYGTEITALLAGHVSLLKSNQHGREFNVHFTWAAGANEPIGTVIGLAIIPSGYRISGGLVTTASFHGWLSLGLAARDKSGWLNRTGTVADDADMLGEVNNYGINSNQPMLTTDASYSTLGFRGGKGKLADWNRGHKHRNTRNRARGVILHERLIHG